LSRAKLERLKIHASETAWVGTEFDHVLDNNGTIDDLFIQIKDILPSADLPLSAKLALDLI